jgi:hypothetical protein
MGDGQHVWAAAEWAMMIRNCFVREEEDHLVLCQGVAPRWLEAGAPLAFGPAPTAFGPASIRVQADPQRQSVSVSWEATWRDGEPRIEVRLPGYPPMQVDQGRHSVELTRLAA